MLILRPSTGVTPRDYALMYVGMGWAVFPVWWAREREDGEGRVCACSLGEECSRPGKHPIGDLVPAGVSDASAMRAKVEAWWGAHPSASIGVATGSTSGITVIDADASEGKPGVVNLTRLSAPHGGIPETFVVTTGGGGLHVYFKYNAALRTGVNVLDEAIDVRNDGGYVIAPPSTHIAGAYAWREERAELKEVPEWALGAPRSASTTSGTRRRGRPRVHAPIPLERVESMLVAVDAEDRDRWLKMGLLLGRMFVGTPGEGEAWGLYEAWAARSSKFDDDRSGNLERMREQFHEASQQEPRTGQTPLGVGTLVVWAREGGWTPFGDRAVIPYEAGNEATMCSALVEALTANLDSNRFFSIMGQVRDIARCKLPSVQNLKRASQRGIASAESLLVRTATTAGVQCALSERAVLAMTSAKTGIQIAKPIPADIATMILKDRANEFPPLAGIAEWPMVMEGEVISRRHGYDPETGLFFDIDPRLELDLNVTAKDGWRWIRDEFFADFPFENELAAAGALGMMLAMMQRPLMKTCPAFAVVAPQVGTGKSTLVEVCALAVHGVPIATHPFSSDDEELRKALHALLVAKAAAVMFDNISRGRSISSDHLAKLITSEAAADRILGSTETRREVNTLLIVFTGNNIAFVRDLASRVVSLRLNARSVNPLGRRFQHPDVRRWAGEHRSRVLSALVAIARANPGPPATGSPSRFEDYEGMIVGAVLEATGEDVRALDVVVDVDAEEDSFARDVLATIHRWQTEWRIESERGTVWRCAELVGAIEARAFPDAAAASIRRFASGSNARAWEADPVRAVSYALRGLKNDYKFHPYLLTGEARKDGLRWEVKREGEVRGEGGGSF